MNTRISAPSLARLLLAGTSLVLVGTRPILAQDEGEWLDPTDWFDGKNVKSINADDYGVYAFDYNYGLGENFDYAEWSTYGRWAYDVWRPTDYDADYWDSQEWYNDTRSIAEPVGGTYSFVSNADPLRKSSSSSAGSDKPADKSDNRSSSQSSGGRKQNQTAQEQTTQTQDVGRRQVAHLTGGKIDGLRNVELRRESGATSTYTLAKVRFENNRNTVVNLGRASQVKDLNLKKEDTIEAIGRRGTVAGETVFVAHRVKSGNRTIDANPTVRLSGQNQRTVTGLVTQIRKAATSRGGPEHTLVEVKPDDGKPVTIDLGPAASLEKIDLQPGERITVRGQTKEKDDRKLIIPELLKVEAEETPSTNSK